MAYRYDFLRVYGGWGINSKMEKKVSRAFFDLRGFGSAATIFHYQMIVKMVKSCYPELGDTEKRLIILRIY